MADAGDTGRRGRILAALTIALALPAAIALAQGPGVGPAGHKNPGPFCKAEKATILGTPGKDMLKGTNKRDVIVGLGGGDKIKGKGGDDLICASGGDDKVNGGDGEDEVRGGRGDDKLKGAGDDDKLRGNNGNDLLNGGAGTDRCNGGKGNDTSQKCEKGPDGTEDVPVIPNRPPDAVDDAATVGEDDGAGEIDVLANDSDPDGDPLTIDSVDDAGTTGVVTTDGATASYDPGDKFDSLAPGETDTDSFSYTADDGAGGAKASANDSATVTVTIEGADDAPEAVDDAETVTEDDPATTIDVLGNDSDVDGGPISIDSVTQPPDGTVVVTNAGADLTYEPDPDFCNDPPGTTTDDFTYTLTPGGSTATVEVTVDCVNDPPTADDDTETVTEDDPATTIDVLANDSDAESDPFSVDSTTQPADGTVAITNAGADLTYEPDPDFCNNPPGTSTDDFTYTLAPGGSTATVEVTVDCVNDPPTAAADDFNSDGGNPGGPNDRNAIGNTTLKLGVASGSAPERVLAGSLLDNDDDPVEGGALTVGEVQGLDTNVGSDTATDLGGTVNVNADGTFTYDPPLGDTGISDSFDYTLEDDGGETDTATATIEVADLIWFVDSSAGGSTDEGSSDNPFIDLNDLNGTDADVDGTGETLFLFQGNSDGTAGNAYGGGIPLEDDQKLIGEPAGLTVDGTELVPADPGKPDITNSSVGAAHGVEFADGAKVMSVATVATSGFPSAGFRAESVGGFSADDAQVRSTLSDNGISLDGVTSPASFTGVTKVASAAAQGIDIDNSQPGADITFDEIDVDSATGAGIRLGQTTANQGEITFSAGDLSNANGAGLLVRKGAADVTFDATIGANGSNGVAGVVVDGRSGGTVSIGGDVTDTGGGIDIGTTLGNTGGTFTFSGMVDLDVTGTEEGVEIDGDSENTTTNFNGGLDIDTVDGTGLVALAHSGAINVAATANNETIDSTSGIAVSIGPPLPFTSPLTAGITLDSISSTDSHDDGVRLQTVGGSFEVTGTTTVDGVADSGLQIASSPATVTLNSIDVGSSTPVGGDGISLLGTAGPVTISGGSITNPGRDAVDIDTGSGNFTYDGTITNNSHSAVEVDGRTGGTVTFGGNITDTGEGIDIGTGAFNTGGGGGVVFDGAAALNTGANTALDIDGDLNSTDVTFNGGLDIDTTTGTGLSLDGLPGLTVNDAGTETIDASSGKAVDVGIGTLGLDVTLDSLTSTDSSTNGIDLDFGSTSGDFTVTGATTITNPASEGIKIADSDANIAFGGQVKIDAATTAADGLVVTGSDPVDFNGGLDIDTGSGTGLSLTNSALEVANAATETIDAAAGKAVQINGGGGQPFAVSFDSTGSTDSPTNGIDINDAGTGTFTVAGVTTVDNPVGDGIKISNSGASFTFGSVDIGDGAATGAGAEGINLDSNTGSFTVNGGDITQPTGNAIDVQGGTGDITYRGTIDNDAARAVEVTLKMGGTASFAGAIDEDGTGINLSSSGGSTINFSGGLDIDTGANTGFNATGGGTVNVTGTNTIGATTPLDATAVNIADTTIGGSGVTFREINVDQSATGGDTAGISLDDTGAGAFTVTGTGTTDGSGGTIEDVTEDAVRLFNTDGPVSLSNMTIEDIGDTSTAAPGHHGVDGQQVDGGLTLDNVTAQRLTDSAIHGEAPGGGSTPWSGLTVRDSKLALSNRFNEAGKADGGATDEAMVTVEGISGTVLIKDNDFDDGPGFVNLFTASSGTLDATVQGNTFDDGRKDLAGVPSVGSTGVRVNTTGTIDADVRIGDPAEASAALGNTFTDTGSDAAIIVSGFSAGAYADVDAVISRNTITVNDHTSPSGLCTTLATCAFDFPNGGIGVESRGSGTFEAIVSHNTLTETQNSGGLSTGSIRVDVSGDDSEAIVRNNTVDRAWDGPLFIRADDADGNGAAGQLLVTNNTYLAGTIGEPGSGDDLDAHGLANSTAPFLPNRFQVRNGATLDLTVDNDDMVSHDTASNPQFDSLDMRINGDAVGGTSSTFNVMIKDTEAPEGFLFRNDDSGADAVDSEFNLSRGASADPAATDITALQAESVLDDNNNTTGGGGSDASVPFSGVNIVTTAPTLPFIVAP